MNTQMTTPTCEICAERATLRLSGDFMPCACKTRCMHYDCFAEWLKHKPGSTAGRCEVCASPYFGRDGGKIKRQWFLGYLINKHFAFACTLVFFVSYMSYVCTCHIYNVV